ncbi:MAG TPA: bifunctional ADP-heptose synthase [Sphingobacteriaceae bacterium]|nr:bifunctional ADP-heptose synthase [Sphingobacteriaceae bacterium]
MTGIFDKFNSLNILIIGDVMVDAYLWGKVERISPEAPVPIVSVTKKENRLGGAANVALNVKALGATPYLCSVIGMDIEGTHFINLLKDQNLSTEGILQVDGRQTTVKTRIISHNQQILRVDEENIQNISADTTQALTMRISDIISQHNINALIFEDYDKGIITEELISQVVLLAEQNNIKTVVDPKKRNFMSYHNVTLFKPNLQELSDGLKLSIDAANIHEVEKAVEQLQQQLNIRNVMVTLSERGVFMSSDGENKLIPAHIRNIADVSGAGDTVIATTAVCLGAGIDAFKTAAIANIAGGLVCEHVGVVPINKEQLLAEAEKL